MKKHTVLVALQFENCTLTQARSFADGVVADLNHERPYSCKAKIRIAARKRAVKKTP